ncbi:hypothetical protein AKAW_10734 [Aspergillus luchuensis IFO 4308]|nr:hypothetical protein AKAW_10734 [Aspergillus luchuensis IFO 4308]
MSHNRATCDSPLGSVAEGPCNRTGIKGLLPQGSFLACFDPHQLASTPQVMSESMAMPYATKGELKARERWFTSEAQVACGYMGFESLLADLHPKTPPNSPRTAPLEPVLTEHMSKHAQFRWPLQWADPSTPPKHIPKIQPYVETRWRNEPKESRRAPAHRNS